MKKRKNRFLPILLSLVLVLALGQIPGVGTTPARGQEATEAKDYKVLFWKLEASAANTSSTVMDETHAKLKQPYAIDQNYATHKVKSVTVADKSGYTVLNDAEVENVELVHIWNYHMTEMTWSTDDFNTTVQTLKNYLKRGGRVILHGELNNGNAAGNKNLTKLAQALGGNMVITSTDSKNRTCVLNTGSNEQRIKNLIEGLNASYIKPLEVADIVSTNTSAVWFMRTGDGTSWAVDQKIGNGYLTVLSDINCIYSNPTGGMKRAYYNLLTDSAEHIEEVENNSVIVTFDKNTDDSTATNPNPATIKVIKDSRYGDLPAMSRTGYTFDGWFTDPTEGTKITPETDVTITAPQTLYAHWTAIPSQVTFNANGGSLPAGTTNPKTVNYGSPYGELPVPTHSDASKIFTGWYTQQTGGDKVEATTIVNKTSNHTLYAQWLDHTHVWELTASGDTATVKCTADNCPYEKDKEYKAKLTPSSAEKTYDGTATTAEAVKDEGFPSEVTISDVAYKKDGATVSDTSNVGSYTAEATVSVGGSSQTITTSFNITEKSLANVTLNLNPSTYVYDGNAKTPTITVKDGDKTLVKDQDYTIDASSITSATALSTGNGYPVKVNGMGNYTGSQTAYWTITKNPTKVTTVPTASAITYGQTLDDSALTPGVAKTADESQTIEGTFTWTNPTTKPEVKDSGTTEYDVTFTPNDTTNYDPCSCKVKLTVNPKTAELAWSDTALTYNGTPQQPTATVTNLEKNSEGVTDECTVTVGGAKTDANAKDGSTNYTATATALGNSNYTLPTDTAAKTTTFTIAQKPITGATVTLDHDTLTYNGSNQTVSVTEVKLDDTTLTATDDYTVSGGTGKDAKGYTVTVTGTGNYKDTATASWTITKATPTVETLPTASAITYGQTLEDSALTGGIVKLGDTGILGSFSWNNSAIKPAVADSQKTEYDVTFTPNDTNNFESIECKVKLTVNKADPVFTAPAANTLTYNGQDQELVTAGETEDGTMLYAVTDNEIAPTDDQAYSENIPKKKDAETYYVWYKVKGDANHKDTEAVKVDVTIAKKELTVTAKANTITYGDAPANDGVEYNGFAAGEDESKLGGTLAYDYSYAQFGDVGNTYTITPKGLTSDNYGINYQTGTLTVEQKEVGLTWGETNFTYNKQPQVPSATATNLVNSDVIGVTVDGAKTNAGENYTATASALTGEKAKNYKLPQDNTTSFTIAKADSTAATVTAINRTYDATEQPLVSATGTVDGGEMRYALGEDKSKAPEDGWEAAIPAKTDAGTYYVWSKVQADANHNDSAPACTEVIISQKELTVTADSGEKEYDGHDLTKNSYTNTDLAKGDAIESVKVTGSQKYVGNSDNVPTEAVIKRDGADVTKNYNITYVNGTLEVKDRTEKYKIIVVSKNAAFTYDGQEHSVINEFETLTFNVNDVDYTVSGLESEGKLTEVGQTPVTVFGTPVVKDKDGKDVSDQFRVGTQSGTLTIEQREAELSWSDTAFTYDGKSHKPTATVANTVNQDKIEVTVDGAQTDAGSYTATASELTGDKVKNYKLPKNNTTSFTIAKAESTPATVSANKRTYDATAQPLVGVDDSKLSGGEMRYAIGENDTTAPSDGWQADIPAKTDAATYYVWSKVQADANHNDSEPKCTEVTVSQKDLTVTADSGEKEYDGKALTKNSYTNTDLAKGDAIESAKVTGSQKYVGKSDNVPTEAVIKRDGADVTKNYNITYKNGSLEVTDRKDKYEITVESNSAAYTYDGKEHSVSGFKTLNFTVDGVDYTVSGLTAEAKATDVGETPVEVKGKAVVKDNEGEDLTVQFNVKTQNGNLTITEATAQVVTPPTAKDLTYNGDAQELVTAGEAAGGETQYAIGTQEKATGEYTDTIPTGKDAETHYVWYKAKGDANHADSEAACIAVTIRKKAINVTAENKNKTFGDADPELTYTAEGLVGGDTLQGALSREEGETAGTYAITQGSLDAGSNYAMTYHAAVLTIQQADSDVKTAPEANKLTYNGDAQALITAGEPLGGEMQYALGENDTTAPTEKWGTTIPTGTDAKTYTVWYRVKGDDSHKDVEPKPIKVTILPKKLTVTADAKSKTYGDADPELTYTQEGLVGGDTLTGELTRTEGENVGTYEILQGSLAAGDNYTMSYTAAVFTINQADADVKTPPTAKELTYNGQAQELVNAGEAEGGTMVYALGADDKTAPAEGWQTAIPTGKDAKTYTVWYRITGDASHESTDPKPVKAAIRQKELAIIADAKSKTYGEADPKLTYTQKGLVEGDSLTGELTRAEGENVGTYDILQGSLTAGDNYKINYTAAKLTINKADQAAPDKPTKDEIKTEGRAITIKVKPGEEYSIDGGKTWKKAKEGEDSVTFDNVEPGKEYAVVARKAATDSQNPSPASEPFIIIIPTDQTAPDKPTAEKTGDNAITVKAKPGEEYSIDGGKTWQKAKEGEETVTFDNLEPGKEYAVVARKAATDTQNPSPASEPFIIIIPTDQTAPDKPTVEKTTSHAITVKAKPGEEYSIDGGKTWIKPKDGEDTVTFDNVEPGKEYAVVARKAATDTQNPSPASEPFIIIIPVGQVKSEIVIGDNLPNLKAEGFNDELVKQLCTPEELKRVEDGEQILYTLKVTRLDNPPAEDKALCENAAAGIGNNAQIGLYLDISIYKKVGDGEPVKVTDTKGNMITVSFDIPAELLQAPANTQRVFFIIRAHDGQAQRIPATVKGNRVTFQTDKFSSYALGYQDTANQNPVTPDNSGDSGNTANNAGQNAAGGSGTAANTGIQGTNNLTIALIIAGIALIIAVTAVVVRRRKDNQ